MAYIPDITATHRDSRPVRRTAVTSIVVAILFPHRISKNAVSRYRDHPLLGRNNHVRHALADRFRVIQPKTASARLFQLVIVPWASMATTASKAVSITERALASARFRSSMSVLTLNHLTMVPVLSRKGLARKKTTDSRRRTGVAALRLLPGLPKPKCVATRRQTVQVVRVDRSRQAPTARLFRRKADELQIVLVKELGASIGPRRPGQRRNRVDGELEITFARSETALRRAYARRYLRIERTNEQPPVRIVNGNPANRNQR